MKFDSLPDMVEYLKNFGSWKDPEIYDFVGSLQIMEAILVCIEKNARDQELEDAHEILDAQTAEFVVKFAAYLSKADRGV